MRKFGIISTLILLGLASAWYFDIWHKPVETIDELVGENYVYAHKVYFQADPDEHYTININDRLNEFNGGVYNKKSILTDSIVEVFTWNSLNHKKTIWVGNTEELNGEIIDAIRYKNSVSF